MRHEINMYNPASPGACWVMECQECFGAVLITGTLEYPLVNKLVTAKLPQTPEMRVWLRMRICDYFWHNWSKLCVHMPVAAWKQKQSNVFFFNEYCMCGTVRHHKCVIRPLLYGSQCCYFPPPPPHLLCPLLPSAYSPSLTWALFH